MAEVSAGERVDVRVALAGDRDDLRALLEECAGDGETDALRGTGDDGDVLSFRSMMCVRPSGSGCPDRLVQDCLRPRAEDVSSLAVIGHACPGDH